MADKTADGGNAGGIPATDDELKTDQTGEQSTENDGGEGGEGDGNAEDELSISLGDEAEREEGEPAEDDETAPNWVKNLRKQNRETARRNRELEDEVKKLRPKEPAIEVGPKPTLESCDYDNEKFEAAFTAWHDRKSKAENAEALKAAETAKQQQAWQQTLAGYAEKKTELKVKDYQSAEDAVTSALSVAQQGIILDGCKNSALLVYALGKNEAQLNRLAKITNPIKFAFAVAELEGKLKVTTKQTPKPEKTVRRSGGTLSGTTDQTLDRLRAEAEKTGNYTKVVQYKKAKAAGGK